MQQTIVTFCMTHCISTWYTGYPQGQPTAYEVIARFFPHRFRMK